MAESRGVDHPWTTVACDDTSEVFVPVSEFFEAGTWEKANGYGEARVATGANLQWALGIQTANDRRSPDAHTRVTSLTSTEGPFDPESTNTSISTTGKRWMRTGWVLKLSSGSTLSTVRVRGRVLLYKQ